MSDQSIQSSPQHEEKFSPAVFITTIVATLAVLFSVLALVFPATWKAQLSGSWGAFAIAFLVVHAGAGVFEFFFHRYILHAPLIPFLSYFYRQHTLHHALTRIGYHRTKRGTEDIPGLVENVVHNTFPIEEEKQHEASYFPWYSLLVFALLVTPALVIAQWILPNAPVFIAGWLAVAWSLSLYELIHAVEHWPQDTWDRLVEHPRYGRFWRKAYAFHLRHHADIRCNEAISGVFGLPLCDFVFGTYIDPETLYTHGKPVDPKEFVSPQPRFAFIRWLDRQADASVRNRRAAARAA